MPLGRGSQRSSESICLPRRLVRFPPSRPASTPSRTECAQAVGCHPSGPVRLAPMCAPDRTAEQSVGASSLPSIAPTSRPSGCPSSRSVAAASYATLLLPTQLSVCCIDQLNPQVVAAAPSETGNDCFYEDCSVK